MDSTLTENRITAGAAGMSDERRRERLLWPDFIRGAAIIAVVSIHISGASGFPDNPLLLWLNSFVMAEFFFVAGALMRRGRRYSAGEFIRRRASAVMWPYLTFSACAVLFELAIVLLSGGRVSGEMISVWLRCVFTLVGKGTLWFLPVFFFSSAAAYAALNARRKETAGKDEPGRDAGPVLNRPGAAELLLFLAGLLAMAFVDWIFGATVAVLTGGGDGAASDVFLVAIRSLAAASVILEGLWLAPLLDRLALSERGALFALACFVISLLVPAFYRMDFRNAQFGACPLLLFVSAAAAYGFLRWGAERACGASSVEYEIPSEENGIPSAENAARSAGNGIAGPAGKKECPLSVLTYFGRNSLTVMTTHLEWYIVYLIWKGMTAVTGAASSFGAGYLARHFAALTLVMMIEYSLCGVINRCFPFLLRLPSFGKGDEGKKRPLKV